MARTQDRVSNAQRALLETSHSIGRCMLESAVELLELNLQATQLAASAGVDTGRAAARSGASAAAETATDQWDPSLVFAYHRKVAEIASRTQAEVAPLMLRQIGEVQSLMTELYTTAAQAAQTGTGGAAPIASIVRAPMEAMQRTMEQTSAAISRAAGVAVQAAGAAAEAAGTAADAASGGDGGSRSASRRAA